MKKIVLIALLVCLSLVCFAQPQPGPHDPPADSGASSTDTGLAPLVSPYTISTAPHFAVLVQFPRADSIRRIAVGNSNYFLVEADKDDPHYAIVKQIRAAGAKAKQPIETNMLVYMASGRVVNIMLKAGKLAETAYSVDYPVPNVQPANDPPTVPPDKTNRERARLELADRMLADVKKAPKKEPGITAGGLTLRFYRTERLDELALVSFDIENSTKAVVDLENPQINLVTAAEKSKDRKKNIPAKIEPIELIQVTISSKQLAPGARAVCLVAFNPPVHDSDQQILLSVANRAMADQPTTFRIE
ncbi:MAG: hypothetical protein L0Z53_02170 [Acidobacteriales bacterium]|nr:hypothetical protein [Terriglobales bacterium]